MREKIAKELDDVGAGVGGFGICACVGLVFSCAWEPKAMALGLIGVGLLLSGIARVVSYDR